MGISDIMERQMKDMKRKLPFRKVAVFLILALFLTAGISMRAVTVNATYRQSETERPEQDSPENEKAKKENPEPEKKEPKSRGQHRKEAR